MTEGVLLQVKSGSVVPPPSLEKNPEDFCQPPTKSLGKRQNLKLDNFDSWQTKIHLFKDKRCRIYSKTQKGEKCGRYVKLTGV